MTARTKSILAVTAICALVAWIGFLVAVNRAMHSTPEQFGRFMSKVPMPAYFLIPFETLWFRARAGTLTAGDMAPDFELQTPDKSGTVRLSSLRRQKPVVLVFGSYT